MKKPVSTSMNQTLHYKLITITTAAHRQQLNGKGYILIHLVIFLNYLDTAIQQNSKFTQKHFNNLP